ncbi:MAG TPA: PAS domain S-box protein [Alphaproteobacteria bacterium]|nr:PAS domain S-box protein [Alphaproteobacteria bacterium]
MKPPEAEQPVELARPTTQQAPAPAVPAPQGLPLNLGTEVLASTAEPSFRRIVDLLPMAVYTTDAEGRITYYNHAAAELWGVRPELGHSEFCGSWKLYYPDGRPMPHSECPMAESLRTGKPIRGKEAVAERPDGTRVPFQPFPTPWFDREGNLTGAVNMLIPLTDRQEDDLVARRLAAIVESSNDAIISMDLEAIVASWNAGAERLFQYTAEEMIGRSVTILLPEDRADEEIGILERIRRGERIEHYETRRRRKDGTILDISLTVSPIVSASGRIVGASKIARDITERRKAEETKAMLLGEMKHRIKNNIATVRAFATMTLRHTSDEERQAFLARLQALGEAHDLLTHRDWDRARLGDVVARALRPFRGLGPDRIVPSGPDVAIDANKVLLVALALHELATNAIKYGALSTPQGRIAVTWTGVENGILTLRWQESGGPEVKPPTRTGFGSRLVERSFSGDIGSATFDFDPRGLVCTLRMHLTPQA